MATFTGSNAAEIIPDLLIGPIQGIGNDFVDALGGDDIAIGWSGDDVIRGGAGADVIIGGLLNAAGIITNSGSDAADYTTSVDGVSIDLSVLISMTLPTLGINIQLTGASQGFGGDAQGDYLSGIVNLIGSNTGADTLTGNAAANTINGQGGDDRIDGGGGNDILLGGDGNDVLIGGAGADSFQGGVGTADTADFSGSAAPVTINLTTGTGTGGDAQGDTFTGIERVIGSGGDDQLNGSAGNDVLIGGAGADVLIGGGGIDTVDYSASGAAVNVDLAFGSASGGDAEGDTLILITNVTGSAYDDVLTGTAATNLLAGGDGNDTLIGGVGFDSLDGGNGVDWADYSTSAVGVMVDLTNGTGLSGDAFGDVLASIENLTGSDYADTLIGSSDDNVFVGGGSADTVDGESGVDTADYSGSVAAVDVDLSRSLQIGGDAEGDSLTNIENLGGSANDDSLTGDAGDNELTGAAGDDELDGGAGTDIAVFSGTFADYDITISGGIATIIDSRGLSPDGTDALTGIETLRFADGDVNVASLNLPPTVSGPVTLTASNEDAAVTIDLADLIANATDPEGDSLSVTGLMASSGTLDDNLDGTWTFTPDANDDTNVTFTYSVTDGNGSVATSATLDLNPVNDDPIVSGPVTLAASDEDTVVTIDLADLVANATDPEGATLSVTGLTASSGSLVDNGDGTWDFTPAANDDTDVTFNYRVSDGSASVATSAMLDLNPLNDDPSVSGPVTLAASRQDAPRDITTAELIGNATDAEGNPLTITGLTASSGTLVDNFDGTWTFTPLAGDNSDVTFNYTIIDGNSGEVDTEAMLDLLPRSSGGGGGGVTPITGTVGSDKITGTGAANEIEAREGDDTVHGLGGNDTIAGDAGRDLLTGGGGADLVHGNDGDDRVFAGADDNGNDKIFGDAGNDELGGGVGNDDVDGGIGRDTLYGGEGNDTLTGGPVGDTAGNLAWAGAGNDRVWGDGGADMLGGGSGKDTISAEGGNDVVYAADGNDNVDGGTGNDTIFGGAGADIVSGEAGNDLLYGGADADVLTGGAGADTFWFDAGSGADQITDFDETMGDMLDLSGLGLSDLSDLSIVTNDGVTVITADGLDGWSLTLSNGAQPDAASIIV